MVEKSNTLIILPPGGEYPKKLFRSISMRGYHVCVSLKGKKNVFARAARSYSMKYNLPFRQLFYGKWNDKNINKYDNLLFFHDKYTYLIVDVLRKKLHYTGEIYVYYMDPIGMKGAIDCQKTDIQQRKDITIFSFEKKDCNRYGWFYNGLFFFKEDAVKVSDYWSDAFFIGTDKGRLKEILRVGEILRDAGAVVELHICKYLNRASDYGKKINYPYKPMIAYDELMQKMYHTKCVLDIVPTGQSEVTLRVYEGLFCGKKIITNNANIRNYDFYKTDNIFVMGHDDIAKIKEFIDGEFDDSIQDEMQKMDFDQWFFRFNK